MGLGLGLGCIKKTNLLHCGYKWWGMLFLLAVFKCNGEVLVCCIPSLIFRMNNDYTFPVQGLLLKLWQIQVYLLLLKQFECSVLKLIYSRILFSWIWIKPSLGLNWLANDKLRMKIPFSLGLDILWFWENGSSWYNSPQKNENSRILPSPS